MKQSNLILALLAGAAALYALKKPERELEEPTVTLDELPPVDEIEIEDLSLPSYQLLSSKISKADLVLKQGVPSNINLVMSLTVKNNRIADLGVDKIFGSVFYDDQLIGSWQPAAAELVPGISTVTIDYPILFREDMIKKIGQIVQIEGIPVQSVLNALELRARGKFGEETITYIATRSR